MSRTIKVYFKRVSYGYVNIHTTTKTSCKTDLDDGIDEALNRVRDQNFNVFATYENDVEYSPDVLQTIKANKC